MKISIHPGPQTQFFNSKAFEILFGGQAGPGKSFMLVVSPLRQINKKKYSALLLRRTFPQLEGAGGLITISRNLYTGLGSYNIQKHTWNFPDDVTVRFSHLSNSGDHYNFQGHEYHEIFFDELSQFEEEQYRYLFSRIRGLAGSEITTGVRSASNPGAVWVKKRWGAWLDKTHSNPAAPGELRYYVASGDGEEECPAGTSNSWSRTFIPGSYMDNPSLDREGYSRNLDMLPLVERQRLKYGDWDVMEGKGLVLNRDWFDIVPVVPMQFDVKSFRFWDLAATEQKNKSHDPDYTATCRLDTNWIDTWITVDRYRWTWQKVKNKILETAKQEPNVIVGVEREQGAAGKSLCDELAVEFAKINRIFHGVRPEGDKVARALRWSAPAEQGKIKLVRGRLSTDEILLEFHGFPERGNHDDMVDATSGAWSLSRQYSKKPKFFIDTEVNHG